MVNDELIEENRRIAESQIPPIIRPPIQTKICTIIIFRNRHRCNSVILTQKLCPQQMLVQH